MGTPIQLFICHSSKDEDIVKRIVDIIVKAFRLPTAAIRCTSLYGYMLPSGANLDQLRDEVINAQVFVAVLTPNTIESMYSMFELGCRWGTRKVLIPIVCANNGRELLSEPLKSINASNANDVPSILHFVDSLGIALEKRSQNATTYIKEVEELAIIIKKKDGCQE